MKKRRALLLGLCVLSASTLSAQSGGSAYSVVGVGDLNYFPSTRSAGMGYVHLAIPSPGTINGISPAAWSSIRHTMLEGTILYQGYNSTDGDRSRYLSNADFNGGLLGFPISENLGIAVVLGFTPYSRVDYDTYGRDLYSASQDTFGYAVHYVGTEGLGKGRLGLAISPIEGLALGGAFEYIFGSFERSLEQIPDDADRYRGGTQRQTTRANGALGTFSAIFSGFGGIADFLEPLSVGGLVSTRTVLQVTERNIYESSTVRDTARDIEGEAVIPLAYGVGMSYRITPRLLVAADYYAQPWRQSQIFGESPPNLHNSHRIGFGMEWGTSPLPSAAWPQRIAFRLGYSYNASYAQLNGQQITEWAVTAGMDFPFSGLTRIALSGSYGQRGTIENNLIKDSIIRVALSLTIGEQWFIRPEDD
jgi:opacity protein-like surface antigen